MSQGATNLSILQKPKSLIFRASSCYWHHFRMRKIHKQQHPQSFSSKPLPESKGIRIHGRRSRAKIRNHQVFHYLSYLVEEPNQVLSFAPEENLSHSITSKSKKQKSRHKITSSRSQLQQEAWDFHFLIHSHALYQLGRLKHWAPQTRSCQ